jgi:hypothetical protein
MAGPQDEQVRACQQLCNNYRTIDDFRAKLLGFLRWLSLNSLSF